MHYIGEVGGTAKQELFANAAALLMPVRWREPFGMVMVEALACGTPVIAFPEGAASEIVIDGENGILVADETEMARRRQRLGSIDPVRCRASVAERYDVSVTAVGLRALSTAGRSPTDRLRRPLRATADRVPETASSSPASPLGRTLIADRAPPPTGTDHSSPAQRAGIRALARVHRRCCDGDRAGAVTIAALRERGVKAPAQGRCTPSSSPATAIDRVRCSRRRAGTERSDIASTARRRPLPELTRRLAARWKAVAA